MLSLHDSQKILGLYNLIIKNTFITDDTCTFEVEMIRKLLMTKKAPSRVLSLYYQKQILQVI